MGKSEKTSVPREEKSTHKDPEPQSTIEVGTPIITIKASPQISLGILIGALIVFLVALFFGVTTVNRGQLAHLWVKSRIACDGLPR